MADPTTTTAAIQAARDAYDRRFKELWDEMMADEETDSRLDTGGCLDAALATFAPLVRSEVLREAAEAIEAAAAPGLTYTDAADLLRGLQP